MVKSILNRRNWRVSLLVLLLLIAVIFALVRMSASRKREQAQKEVCALFWEEVALEFAETSGTIQANHFDSNGSYYFLAEDERCIYRLDPSAKEPEAVVQNAIYAFSIWEDGIFFIRTVNGEDMLYYLDSDGNEEVVLADFPVWGYNSLAVVRNYLLYPMSRGGLYAQKIDATSSGIRLGEACPVLPDCDNLICILWIDDEVIWYIPFENGNGFDVISRLQYQTGESTDYTIARGNSRLVEGCMTELPYAVYDGTLIFYDSANQQVMSFDFQTATVEPMFSLDAYQAAFLYRSVTGSCFARILHDYRQCTTIDLFGEADTSFLTSRDQTIQEIYGSIAIISSMDFLEQSGRQEYYPRTTLYDTVTGDILWESSGAYYRRAG